MTPEEFITKLKEVAANLKAKEEIEKSDDSTDIMQILKDNNIVFKTDYNGGAKVKKSDVSKIIELLKAKL